MPKICKKMDHLYLSIRSDSETLMTPRKKKIKCFTETYKYNRCYSSNPYLLLSEIAYVGRFTILCCVSYSCGLSNVSHVSCGRCGRT